MIWVSVDARDSDITKRPWPCILGIPCTTIPWDRLLFPAASLSALRLSRLPEPCLIPQLSESQPPSSCQGVGFQFRGYNSTTQNMEFTMLTTVWGKLSMTKGHLGGRKGFYLRLSGHTPSMREVRAGTWGQEQEQRPWSNCLLVACQDWPPDHCPQWTGPSHISQRKSTTGLSTV